jgi:hypothetical protein
MPFSPTGGVFSTLYERGRPHLLNAATRPLSSISARAACSASSDDGFDATPASDPNLFFDCTEGKRFAVDALFGMDAVGVDGVREIEGSGRAEDVDAITSSSISLFIVSNGFHWMGASVNVAVADEEAAILVLGFSGFGGDLGNGS